MTIINRFLQDILFNNKFKRQMRFISGPRQSGKTTIAKIQLERTNCNNFYYNWDLKEVRDRFRQNSNFLKEDLLKINKNDKLWVCFDEIHKMPDWKNILKGFFDNYEDKVNFIVTGSAKLDFFRRSGDSLAGRYFIFRLYPLILAEITGKKVEDIVPELTAEKTIEKFISGERDAQNILEQILKFGSFPEPFINNSEYFLKKWHESYFERIIYEDIRSISGIQKIRKLEDLTYLLPSKIGSPLSINSLKKDLELNFNTVVNYLKYLFLTFVIFEIQPYKKNLKRLIKKEKKIYLYDFSLIPDEAAKFENFVAHELKTRIELWNEITNDKFELFFIRTRDKKETDFLIIKNSKPFFLCEAKLQSTEIENHHYLHSRHLGQIPFIQIIKKENVLKVIDKNFYIVSASKFFK